MALTPAERAKRYRENLKLNKEKYEAQRKKQIERVKKGQKKIRELSDREKEERRKIWREQKKKQRNAKKQAVEIAVPSTSQNIRTVDYRRKYNNLANKYKTVLKQLNKLRTFNANLRKTLSRTKEKYQKEINLKTEENVKLKTRHELLEISLGEKYKDCKTQEQKKTLRSIGRSKTVLQKRGSKALVSKCLGLKGCIRFTSNKNYNASKKVEEEMEVFYNRDEISRSTSGKRECKTKHKKKMQIRYLTDTLINLYQIYKTGGGKFSLSTFCKYKPFYVLSPRSASRDTCLCVKHSNFEYLITALKKYTFPAVVFKGTKDLIELTSCDIKSFKCMYGLCDKCRNKKNNFETNNNYTEVEWWKWERAKKKYKKKMKT